MKKLTDRQMKALAGRVVDTLEEAYKEKQREVIESEDYVNFNDNYQDEYVEELKPLAEAYVDVNKKIEVLKEEERLLEYKAKMLRERIIKEHQPSWRTVYPDEELKNYLKSKKDEKFKEVLFDREKITRQVEADILLSDIDNPEQLVKSLIEKLKVNE